MPAPVRTTTRFGDIYPAMNGLDVRRIHAVILQYFLLSTARVRFRLTGHQRRSILGIVAACHGMVPGQIGNAGKA